MSRQNIEAHEEVDTTISGKPKRQTIRMKKGKGEKKFFNKLAHRINYFRAISLEITRLMFSSQKRTKRNEKLQIFT